MRVSKLANTSGEPIDVKLKEGSSISLPPGAEMHNVEISNFEDLKGKIKMTEDLSEVTSTPGKTRLDD